MKLTISDASKEIARLLRLFNDHPNHPNRPKWLSKAQTYAGTIANALETDERIINV